MDDTITTHTLGQWYTGRGCAPPSSPLVTRAVPHVTSCETAKQCIDLLLHRHGDAHLRVLTMEKLAAPARGRLPRPCACFDNADGGVLRGLDEREYNTAGAVADGATNVGLP